MGVFLSSMAYFEGASPKERLQKAYIPGMTNNFLLWPWVQAVNFKFVPLEHRVLVVNFVALGEYHGCKMKGDGLICEPGWNCYLSYLNGGGGDPPKPGKSSGKEGGELPPS
jgi:protein Mpv17